MPVRSWSPTSPAPFAPPPEPRSGCALEPAEQRRPHRLVDIQVLRAGARVDFAPDVFRQAHRSNDRLADLAFSRIAAAKENRIRRELRHLPQREQRGPAALAGAGERVPPDRAEAREVDRAGERISRPGSV